MVYNCKEASLQLFEARFWAIYLGHFVFPSVIKDGANKNSNQEYHHKNSNSGRSTSPQAFRHLLDWRSNVLIWFSVTTGLPN